MVMMEGVVKKYRRGYRQKWQHGRGYFAGQKAEETTERNSVRSLH